MEFCAPHVWQSSIVWHRLARSTFDGLRRSELIRLIGQACVMACVMPCPLQYPL